MALNRIATELEKNGSKPAGEELLAKLTSNPCFAGNYDFGFGGQGSLPKTLVDLNYVLPTLQGDLLADENFASYSILNDISNNFAIGQKRLSDITTTQFIDIDNSILENASREVRFAKKNITEISFVEPTVVHSRLGQSSTFKVSPFHRGISDSSIPKESSAENRIIEIDIFNDSIGKPRSTQVSSTQIDTKQTSLRQIDSTEINSTQTDVLQLDTSQVGIIEISFASSISPEQFFSVHNSTLKITNVLNNSATNIWSNLLQSDTQLDIDFQITDLPKGQLASATITGFDDAGKSKAGRILIDHDANGVGWFIDETPLDNSEFTAHLSSNGENTESYLLAATESEADGK